MLKRSLRLIPARTELYQAKLGFYLLIASLGMFFAGSLVTYVTIHVVSAQPSVVEPDMAANDDLPTTSFKTLRRPLVNRQTSLEPLVIPRSFYISTVVLIGVSISLHYASLRVSQEKQRAFRRYLIAAMILALVFILIQTFGMSDLVWQHLHSGSGSMKMYGIAFVLAFIHALHVYGGLVFLCSVLIKAFRDKYDHERHWSVDICASYWHFLDVVWIAMLATFIVTG